MLVRSPKKTLKFFWILSNPDDTFSSNHYKDTQGNLYPNSSNIVANTYNNPIYASAYVIQFSPSMVCPYYNNTNSYTSSAGTAYAILCGNEFNNLADMAGGGAASSKKFSAFTSLPKTS